MARYLVIENETKSIEMIQNFLREFDASAIIEPFIDFEHFQTKINSYTLEQKSEFLKFEFCLVSLFKKEVKEWKTSLEQLHILLNQKIDIYLLSYENQLLSFKFLQSLNVVNVFYKPFDSLILKENLFIACQKQKKASTRELVSQKAAAFIGLLKEVELQSICELGFMTLSDAPIPVGSIAKYLSPLFSAGKKQSVWAQCLISAAHPQKPGYYINKFQFYAVTKEFLNQIRRYVLNLKKNEISHATWHMSSLPTGKRFKVALVAHTTEENLLFKKDLESYFKNLDVDFLDFVSSKNKNALLDYHAYINLSEMSYEKLKTLFNTTTLGFLVVEKTPEEESLRDFSLHYSEVFIQPIDKSYFYKKLKTHLTELIPNEELHLTNISCHEKIKAANKAKISEINELYMTFNYSRSLEYHEYREFIFLNADEDQVVEIPGFCHFKDKVNASSPADKNIYFHQFIFFGMTDHYLKEIRLWLLHNHIMQNKDKVS